MEGFQNLSDFVIQPFGNVDSEEQKRLEKIYQSNKKHLKIEGYTIIDDDYFIHIKVPSDSNPNQFYDVVFLFFTDNNKVKRGFTLNKYYVKFFSNSPSFIYQFAALYRINGFLIDFLFDKMDAEYAETPPKNPKKMMYDKSIYCASKFLLDSTAALSKLGLVTRRKKDKEKFFSDIKTFKDVKLTNELSTLDKKIDKELEKNKSNTKRSKVDRERRNTSTHRTVARKDTLQNTSKKCITTAKRIQAKKKIKSSRRKK